jgi:hypothetical protein
MAKKKLNKTVGILEAAAAVLEAAGAPMHYTDIAAAIGDHDPSIVFGAKPGSEVYTAIYNDISSQAGASRFVKAGRGEFFLAGVEPVGGTEVPAEADTPAPVAGFIQAFGMYWQYDKVDWKNQPSLHGKAQRGAKTVDFGAQKGVYLLHDGRHVVYVGRTNDQTIGQRLLQHTYDRLNGRWDRFSWFGVLPVNEDGSLGEAADGSFGVDDLISAMEALLIEAIEPPQNRRRGDQISAVEYLQVTDPGLGEKGTAKFLAAMAAEMARNRTAL